MKKITLIALVSLVCFVGKSQKRERRNAGTSDFSIGVDGGLPLGLSNIVYSVSLGANAQIYKPLNDNFGLTGSIGYQALLGKKFSDNSQSYTIPTASFIPIMAGTKYEFTPSVFGMAEAGVAIGLNNGTGVHFAYSPSVGCNITQNIDLGLKYKSIVGNGSSLSQLVLRLGYNF